MPLGLLGSIVGDVVSDPIGFAKDLASRHWDIDVDAMADQAREKMDDARTLGQSITDYIPDGVVPSLQTLVGMSSRGSAVGASMPTPEKFMVDDVLFQVVEVETVDEESDIPRHPTEDRKMIADHTWRIPLHLNIHGSLIGYPVHTERHKLALEALQGIKQRGEPVNVICDFPPGELPDMVLKRFSVTREYPWKNEYQIALDMEQAEFVGRATTESGLPDVSGADPGGLPGAAVVPEGPPSNLGMQESNTGEDPPRTIFGNILGKVRDGISALGDTKLGRMALDWGKDMLRNTVPGAGLVMDALSGNLDARSLLEAGASFIPGGPALLNTALGALDAGMGALEAVGGLGAISDVVTGKTSVGDAARNAVGGLIDSAVGNNPALGAIGGMAKGALGV